jgi:DNA polymerase-3 subunit beta
VKLTVDQAALARAASAAASIAPAKSPADRLRNVLLVAAGERLELVATDTTVTLTTGAAATVATPGAVCLDAAAFAAAASALAKGEISLAVADDRTATLKGGKGGRRTMELSGLDPADFPERPAPPEAWVTLPPALVARLALVAHAAKDDPSYAHLRGVWISLAGSTATAVALDGLRLAKAEAALEGPVRPCAGVVSAKGLTQLLALMEGGEGAAIEIAFEATRVHLRAGADVVAAALPSDPFPNFWANAIPGDPTTSVRVERDALASAVGAVLKVAGDGAAALDLAWREDALEVALHGTARGRGRDVVDAQVNGPDGALVIHGKRFAEALRALPGDVAMLEFGAEALDNVLLRAVDDPAALVVVSPMKGAE